MELVHGESGFAIEVRRHLHRFPELSLQEYETSAFLQQHLSDFGIKFQIVGRTGIYGYVEGTGNGGGSVLLRADIDALPIEEETTLAFKSEHAGVMHACGHDIHTASLLTALKWLAEHKQCFGGRIYFAFQPAEEFGHGAQFFTEAGLSDGYDRVFGLHIAPDVPVGRILVSRQEDAASCDYFKISLEGEAAHATTPELGKDALLAVSELAVQIHSLPTEFLSPWEQVNLSVGKITAGEAFNIIADRAELEGSLRAFSDEVRTKLHRKLQDLVKAIELKHELKAKIEISCFAEPLRNAVEAVADLQELAGLFPEIGELQLSDRPAMGFAADDFSDFTSRNPGLYVHVGTRDEQSESFVEGLHSARLEPDERAIPLATDLYLNYALYCLWKQAGRGKDDSDE